MTWGAILSVQFDCLQPSGGAIFEKSVIQQ